MNKVIADSELILNPDRSIFHLHMRPEQLADNIILVGDPARVDMIVSFFDKTESSGSNREFRFTTGFYGKKRITVLSTGIGTDNIDIVLNELDALANIDLQSRTVKEHLRQLTLVRIGTSGGLQIDNSVDSFVVSEKSIGFDGLLNFYARRDEVADIQFEKAFMEHVKWDSKLTKPYVVNADKELVERIAGVDMKKGVTISAPGFYGPQGRVLRLPLNNPFLNERISTFAYGGYKIANFEMESSAVAGLSLLMGHKAVTVCQIIANRIFGQYSKNYNIQMKNLVQKVLERI